jgi:hypothetical protein
MMQRAVQIAAALAALLGAGCAPAMRPVTFEASPADWEKLSGEWRGEYTMAGHDRHGVISFRLKGGAREAAGDVLMIPDRFAWPYTGGMPPRDAPAAGRTTQDTSQLLTISFVGAERGLVVGNMTPYWDPDRGCRALASFSGSVDGDVIAGTFISVCEDGVRTLKGRWRVERNRHQGPPR